MEIQRMPGHLIRRLHQISTQVFLSRAKEAGFDLTPVQFAAMQALGGNPGIEQAQVASLIAYDRATIGGVIDRLEQKGYVNRIVSRRDRRAREVSLSDAGRSVLDALTPLVRTLQDDILGHLDADERALFTSLAQKAVGGIAAEAKAGSNRNVTI